MKIKETKVAYKVCRGPVGRNFSAISRRSDVKYALDHVTRPKPKCNPFLFVFNTASNAWAFRSELSSFTRYTIYKGLAINPHKHANTVSGGFVVAASYPKGTFFCEAFVPLEVVS